MPKVCPEIRSGGTSPVNSREARQFNRAITPRPLIVRLVILLTMLVAGLPLGGAATKTTRPLGRESAAYQETRELLPRKFREYESRRYIVFSSTDADWTRQQIKRLEKTCDQFNRYTNTLRLEPHPLQHKLVCVLFDDRKAYAKFGKTHDRVNSTWSYGYYSPGSDRVVLFNGEAEKDADEFAPQRTIATTIHEAIHQLHYHTKVQNKHVQYPLWNCEGVATSFETSDPDKTFGPDEDFKPRRERFEGLLKKGNLLHLRSLVQLDHMPDNRRQTVFAVYNQSYALFSWLTQHRGDQLRLYFKLMREQTPGRLSAARHLELFTKSFGDIERLEKAWLQYEARRLGTTSVAPEILKRLQISTLTSPKRNQENDHETHDLWIDDFDLVRVCRGMHDLSGVSGQETAAH